MQVAAKKFKEFMTFGLEQYLARSGRQYADLLKADSEQSHPWSKGGYQDEKLADSIKYAEKVTNCAGLALRACSSSKNKPYQQLIIDKFFKGLTNYEVIQDLHCSDYKYKLLQNGAYCTFANYFLFYQMKQNVKPLINLLG